MKKGELLPSVSWNELFSILMTTSRFSIFFRLNCFSFYYFAWLFLFYLQFRFLFLFFLCSVWHIFVVVLCFDWWISGSRSAPLLLMDSMFESQVPPQPAQLPTGMVFGDIGKREKVFTHFSFASYVQIWTFLGHLLFQEWVWNIQICQEKNSKIIFVAKITKMDISCFGMDQFNMAFRGEKVLRTMMVHIVLGRIHLTYWPGHTCQKFLGVQEW